MGNHYFLNFNEYNASINIILFIDKKPIDSQLIVLQIETQKKKKSISSFRLLPRLIAITFSL